MERFFWVLTDHKEFTQVIKACFAESELGIFDYPERLRLGDKFSLSIPVTNVGCKGEVGLRIFDGDTEVERLRRIDNGETTYFSYSSEMPVKHVFSLRLDTIHLDRNRAIVIDGTKIIDIRAANSLLHEESSVTIYGGYRELNPVTGFVAGKNLRISGLDSSIGTGGPPFLPYGGYLLSGNLGPGDIATIEFDELYFFRVEMGKEIATAMLGSLIDRATTIYEYSVIPTPAMALRVPKAFGVMLTEAVPRLEV